MGGAAPDSLGLRDAALRAPELVTEAAQLVAAALGSSPPANGTLPARERIEAVLLLGAGEGETAGRLVAAVAAPILPVPLVVASGYAVPAFATSSTLTLALSWDGDGEEVVEACVTALDAGAPVVAVTSPDGDLAAAAAPGGATVVPVPSGAPAARAGTSALVAAAVTILGLVGLFPGADEWVRLAAAQLTTRRDEADAGTDACGAFGRLGRRLAGTIPLVQGADALGGAAAASLAARVRLDTKGPAWCSTMPNLGHDEIAGWGQHGDITRQLVSVVQLRHDHEHPALAARFDAANDLMAEAVAGIHDLHAAGEGALAQALDLVLQGDLVALAMAAEAGLDPGPVPYSV